MRPSRASILFLFLLVTTSSVGHAQSSDEPPYLYYYSQMLGGLIIERADGTDSRQIGANLIPADMTGIAGPGWSPSGKYFAAYSIEYRDYRVSYGKPYLMNLKGEAAASWLDLIPTTSLMQWSPSDKDILLVAGNYRGDSSIGLGTFFWVIDAETGKPLVEFGANLGTMAYDMSAITWDMPHEQIIFYLAPQTYDEGNYYRVTLQFDGTTLREPVSSDKFQPLGDAPVIEENLDVDEGHAVSPSGRYEANGIDPTILTDRQRGEKIELPTHTQGTSCRDYRWTSDEQYLITLNGTLRAGGGCAGGVIGVTDSEGGFWRELGGCTWGFSPCIDWLPENVNIDSLPSESPTPVQLDPFRFDYEAQVVFGIGMLEIPNFVLHCGEGGSATIDDSETGETIYMLTGANCPYHVYDSLANGGPQIVTSYDSAHDLLATYHEYFDAFVTIWTRHDGDSYEPMLRLNSDGYALEFTDGGQYLRARNVNGWKVYAVADILKTINR